MFSKPLIPTSELKIFVETLDPKYNSNLTSKNCLACDCDISSQDDFEILIHCLILKSPFITKNKKDATFIFLPIYTNLCRKSGIEFHPHNILKKDEHFQKWNGAKHIVADSIVPSNFSDDSFLSNFSDQHLIVSSSIPINFIRKDRWLNSRHILIPPISNESELINKTEKVVYFGEKSFIFENISSSSVLNDKIIATSLFTIINPSINIHPFLIYSALKLESIPILIIDSYLPAYAHVVDYNKYSIRISPNEVEKIKEKVEVFDRHINFTFVKKVLSWSKSPESEYAQVFYDLIETRHQVLKPVLRRTFLKSEKYI